MTIENDLAAICGSDFASDDPAVLGSYLQDTSFTPPGRAECVAFPKGSEEVQEIIRYASQRRLPVVPRSSKISFHGAGIPAKGGIILDLSRMNRVLEVDPAGKRVKLEAGASWGQVTPELAKHGLMVCPPLLPHRDKSVVTSAMQREPMLIPKSEYSEMLLTAEVVLASGEALRTGTAMGQGMKGQCFPDALVPGTRLFMGAQGTLGIITWAILKAEHRPAKDKLFFIPFERLEDVPECVYRIQRRMLGSECLVLNRLNLATILAESPGEIEKLSAGLPAWTVLLCLSGFHRLPEEKIAYEEEALWEITRKLGLKPDVSVTGCGGELIPRLRQPWPDETYWKDHYRGGWAEVFFYDTLDKAPRYLAAMTEVTSRHGYAAGDIGVYLQPVERARILFYRFTFYTDPEDKRQREMVKEIFVDSSQRAMAMGALFTTPYGSWADMVYRRAPAYAGVLKTVKDALDPDHILNPGKLCF
ncbi:MAG: FAD-binding oxidoreductase [Dehalococcoidia bacterium]|nr:MAG: FAD-binding oxidoreductase [Dehalococcoidia bacterium]